MPSLVIFDMDGVLIDSETLACELLREQLAVEGIALDFAEIVRTFVGRSTQSPLAIYRDRFGMADPEAFHARVRDAWRRDAVGKLKAMPHVPEILAALDRPKCIASSTSIEGIAISLKLTGL